MSTNIDSLSVCRGHDAVIETLANSEAALIQCVAALDARCRGYRLVALQAVARLHEQHVEIEKLAQRYHRTLDDARTLREELRRRQTQPQWTSDEVLR